MDEDALELVRRIEEEFSIYLPAEDLLEVYTIGNLYNLLLRILKPTPDFQVGRAFFQLRSALATVLEIPARSIRPSTFLDDLIDQKHIHEQWGAIASTSGLVLPGLEHTASWKLWMKWIAALLTYPPIAAAYHAVARHLHGDFANIAVLTLLWFVGLFLWASIWALLLKITSSRACVLPVLTIGELGRAILLLNEAQFRSERDSQQRLTDSEVWRRLAGILQDQAGFAAGEIVPSASLLRSGVLD